MCSCGDYEYQASLLETIFRICQGNLIKLFAADFFPGTESLQHAFVKFDIKNFDNATRTFLNIVNKVFQNVYSFVAGEILLDNENVIPPMVSIEFNCCARSWYIIVDVGSAEKADWIMGWL